MCNGKATDTGLTFLASLNRTVPDCEAVHGGGPRNGGPRDPYEVHWKRSAVDLEFPPVPMPTRRVFDVAGETGLRALVARHHERLRDSPVGHLFPFDGQRFEDGIRRAGDFTVEKSGGPVDYAPPDGRVCMRTRHFAFTIDEHGRDVWLAQLLLAFDDVDFPREVREEFWNWVEAMSIRMINRRTTKASPTRYPYADARRALAHLFANRRRPVMCPR